MSQAIINDFLKIGQTSNVPEDGLRDYQFNVLGRRFGSPIRAQKELFRKRSSPYFLRLGMSDKHSYHQAWQPGEFMSRLNRHIGIYGLMQSEFSSLARADMPFELDDVRQDKNEHFEEQILPEHPDCTGMKLVQEPFRCLVKQNGKLFDIVGWLLADKVSGTLLTFSTRFVDKLIEDMGDVSTLFIGDQTLRSMMHTEAILSKFWGALMVSNNDDCSATSIGRLLPAVILQFTRLSLQSGC